MKKRIKLFALLGIALFCMSIGSISAATYSKTKTKEVSYYSECTGKIYDKASVNSSSLDWTFNLAGATVKTKNGYNFAPPYSSGVTYTNARKTATHKVGYYFYNSLGNSVGGGIHTFKFNYNGSNAIS